MRYIIFVYPFSMMKPIATDFRLIAYIIAFYKSIFYTDLYVFDDDKKVFIFSKGSLSLQQLQDQAKSFPPQLIPKEGTPKAQNF